MPETIVDNPHITMLYHPDKGIVHHVFHKTTQGRDLKDNLYLGVHALRDHGAHKWLSDDRKNGAVAEEDLAWMDQWAQDAVDAGWTHWALIVPENVQGRGDMAPVVEKYFKLGVTLRLFTREADAWEWLESV